MANMLSLYGPISKRRSSSMASDESIGVHDEDLSRCSISQSVQIRVCDVPELEALQSSNPGLASSGHVSFQGARSESSNKCETDRSQAAQTGKSKNIRKQVRFDLTIDPAGSKTSRIQHVHASVSHEAEDRVLDLNAIINGEHGDIVGELLSENSGILWNQVEKTDTDSHAFELDELELCEIGVEPKTLRKNSTAAKRQGFDPVKYKLEKTVRKRWTDENAGGKKLPAAGVPTVKKVCKLKNRDLAPDQKRRPLSLLNQPQQDDRGEENRIDIRPVKLEIEFNDTHTSFTSKPEFGSDPAQRSRANEEDKENTSFSNSSSNQVIPSAEEASVGELGSFEVSYDGREVATERMHSTPVPSKKNQLAAAANPARRLRSRSSRTQTYRKAKTSTARTNDSIATQRLVGSDEDSNKQIKQNAEKIFGEFAPSDNSEEFLRAFCEKAHPTNVEKYIAYFLDVAIEQPRKIRRLRDVLRVLYEAGIANDEILGNVFSEKLIYAETAVVDTPNYHDWVIAAISSLVNKMNTFSQIKVMDESTSF